MGVSSKITLANVDDRKPDVEIDVDEATPSVLEQLGAQGYKWMRVAVTVEGAGVEPTLMAINHIGPSGIINLPTDDPRNK